jgi:hypothetical protein
MCTKGIAILDLGQQTRIHLDNLYKNKKKERKTYIHIYIQTYKHTEKQTYRQTDRQKYGQAIIISFRSVWARFFSREISSTLLQNLRLLPRLPTQKSIKTRMAWQR